MSILRSTYFSERYIIFSLHDLSHKSYIFLFEYFPDNVSHCGDMSEILQSVIYIIKCFLAMNASG